MTQQLRSIAFVAGWVLLWGVGGSLIDATLIQSGVYDLETGQLGTATTFVLWTVPWGVAGLGLWRRLNPAQDPS